MKLQRSSVLDHSTGTTLRQPVQKPRRAAHRLAVCLLGTSLSLGCGSAVGDGEPSVASSEAAVVTGLTAFTDADIGAVGLAGSSVQGSGQYTISGSGADIWGSGDAFHYGYQRLNGNTQLVARVTSLSNTNPWAKAGIMIRESLLPGARHAFVALTPGNGVAFQARTATNGTSVGTNVGGVVAPTWLKLARSGNRFTAYRSGDGVTWTQVGATLTIDMGAVVYAGLAVTSHDTAQVATANFTNVELKAPPVLFVVGSATLIAGDAAAKRRLETLGYSVVVKTADVAVAADATGKDLVVISSSVSSSLVNTKFTNATVPVLTWENAILDDLGMTGTASGVDYGTTATQTSASIFSSACDRATMYTAAFNFADGCHDMTAGLSGTFQVLSQSGTLSWGKPSATAVKIAFQPGDASKAIVFGYEKGVVMPGLASAPARRAFVFMSDGSAAGWTGRGQSLFDNAVYWATNTKYSITKKVLVLNFDPILTTQGNVRMDVYGTNRYGWAGDPLTLTKNYLADQTEASGGYVRWQWAKYPEIPDYINRWAPITGSVQFNSASYSEQQYLQGYDIGPSTGNWAGAQAAMPNGGNYLGDYNRVFDDYGVDAKVQNGEVDEVVMYGHPFSGFFESSMAGRTAYWVNGSPVTRNAPNFMAMGLNYERGLSEALESFGHRAEQLIANHVYRNSSNETLPYNTCYWPDFSPSCSSRAATPQRDLWDRFTAVDGILPGLAGVGALHWAPNAELHATNEYRWDLTNLVNSMADDWEFNYPNLVGTATRRLVNVDEWTPMAQDGNPGRGFKKWWYHHLPRVPGLFQDAGNGANDAKLNNWWEYIVNFNRHVETMN